MLKVILPPSDDRPIQYIGRRQHNGKAHNQYRFICSCGAEGELGVRVGKTDFVECPDKCGSLFIQLPPIGMFGEPRLVEVTSGAINRAQKVRH